MRLPAELSAHLKLQQFDYSLARYEVKHGGSEMIALTVRTPAGFWTIRYLTLAGTIRATENLFLEFLATVGFSRRTAS